MSGSNETKDISSSTSSASSPSHPLYRDAGSPSALYSLSMMSHLAQSPVPTCCKLVVYSPMPQPVSTLGTPKLRTAAPHTDVVAGLAVPLPIARFSPSWSGALCCGIGGFGAPTRCMAGEFGVIDWYSCSSSGDAGVVTGLRGAGRKGYGRMRQETCGG